MNQVRRMFLQRWTGATALACAFAAGVLRSTRALAAEWNQPAFESKTLADAMQRIGAEAAVESPDVTIKAPDIAENGAVIAVEVTSRVPGAESIALLAEKNTYPLIAQVDLANGAEAYLNTRIKMGQSSVVKAVVKAGGKSYVASKEIKVTLGGCGG